MPQSRDDDRRFMAEALAQASAGLDEGGIPIGAVLVVDGEIVGRGRNRRLQQGDPILHGEMDCLRDAGRLPAAAYRRAVMYTTLSPCDMCSGAVLLYGIPRLVLAENRTFAGAEELLRARGVEVCNLDLDEAVELMKVFVARHPEVWAEDIGEDESLVVPDRGDCPDMIKKVAFTMYPVRDVARARTFYEQTLGLEPGLAGGQGDMHWIEYDLPGGGCLAITNASQNEPSAAAGGTIALEVEDLTSLMEDLRGKGVPFKTDIIRGPRCRMVVVLDSEGNSLVLHQMDPEE